MNFNSRGIKTTAKTCIISLKSIIIIRKKQSVRNFERQLNEPPLSNAKECSKYHTIAVISHSSKVIPQLLQARLQKYVNRELPNVQAGFQKAEEPEIKLPISTGSLKKQESPGKTSISVLLTMPKPSTVWITINCGKFWKRWEYQTTWPASWETCMQVRRQQLELDMEKQTGSK